MLQVLVMIWWFVDAHKWFKGPKVNLEHLMHGRDEQAAHIAGDGDVLEGKGDDRSSSDDNNVLGDGKQVGDMKPGGL
jgi:hypothetical protein